MANPEQLEMVKRGPKIWNEWRGTQPSGFLPNLSGASLSGAHLSGASLSGANLGGANLSKAHLSEAHLSGASLSGANLGGANLSKAHLSEANLSEANLSEASLSGANLGGANLSGANLSGANLSGAHLGGANLSEAHLSGANLSGANLSGAYLVDGTLVGAIVDGQTQLDLANVDGCRIERYQLECLEKRGGLTNGALMTMHITDGVAALRASYSGFWQWIHLAALGTFLLPYLWFIGVQWSRAAFQPAPGQESLYLYETLWLFIFNGGENLQQGPMFHWSFVAFLFLLAYNILRGVLLWKTKSLELEQEASGLPIRFSLGASGWGPAFALAKYAFFINLVVVALNTAHFFHQKVPLEGLDSPIVSIVVPAHRQLSSQVMFKTVTRLLV